MTILNFIFEWTLFFKFGITRCVTALFSVCDQIVEEFTVWRAAGIRMD